MTFSINSDAFKHEHEIPSKYTCEGDNISPSLNWSELPSRAKSLALIVDDPDAPDPENPQRTWVHWVLYNIPVTVNNLEEAITNLPMGTKEGLNDWNRTGYGGPCPPIGRHRYFFKLYALDIVLPELNQPNKHKLEKEMEKHIIKSVTLIGTYQKVK